ncbi:hypothetical protein KM043_000252 [Ampulex compressa]|nr:hypothetical protein KM043_000252 [Ampulex compressa]
MSSGNSPSLQPPPKRPYFPAVIDGQINTLEFLAAAREIVRIVDQFGKLFAPVKYDMQGNIEKLTSRYVTDVVANSTLQSMILREKSTEQILVAADALTWLTRGLHLILLFFERIVQDSKLGNATEDLGAFLRKSYKEALEPYHGWMAQQLFGLLSRMVPTRSQFLRVLAAQHTDTDEMVVHEVDGYLVNLRENVLCLQRFYEEHNLGETI